MKRPRYLLGWIFGALHLAFCVLFFAAYFTSPDSERGMALYIFAFIDPWMLLFFSAFSGSIHDEIIIAAVLTLFGSAGWWGVGWMLAKIIGFFGRHQKNA